MALGQLSAQIGLNSKLVKQNVKTKIDSLENLNLISETTKTSFLLSEDKKNLPFLEKKTVIKKRKFQLTNVELNVNTIPENVEVHLDGKFIGKTPISGKKILSGNHTFDIQKNGFAPISYDLNVNASKSVNLDFFLNPVYNIKFKTNEPGLIFELNDNHRWTEDMIKMQLEAGDHQLRVYRLGEIIDEQIIVADQPLTFQYYLKKGMVIKP
ncbi:PEGA domain-containing protein [Candidatus Marinimicrobia bacterium]|nr:PEGA domain-containing protein [Candidatus Neomarinimicrobiota bacterium]